MTKLPVMTFAQVIRGLKKAGFVFDRLWYNPITRRRTTIPNHPGSDIPKGNLKAIIKEAGISLEEFLDLIRCCSTELLSQRSSRPS